MHRLAKGDDLALNVLMDRWSARVVAFLLRMTGQREVAGDLAQETFVKLYQARNRYRAQGTFSTYLFAIAANLARNHARWKRRHPTVSMDAPAEQGNDYLPTPADAGPSPADELQTVERIRAVDEAFALLPPDLREAMTLFVYEGLGYAEIAAISRCSVKAAETRIYRARQILKANLKDLTATRG